MFSFMGGMQSPIRKAQSYLPEPDAPDLGSGLEPSGGFTPDNQQPEAPSFMQAFRAGAQGQRSGRNMLLGGLAGQAGRGGFLGGLGRVAGFLL